MQYAIMNADAPNHTDMHTVLTIYHADVKSHHTHTPHGALYKPPPHTATTTTHRPLTCKNTTSTSCKGSRPSWVPVGAQDAATKMQLAPKHLVAACCSYIHAQHDLDPLQFALVVFSCTNYIAHLLMCTHDLPCCHCTLQLTLVVFSYT